MPDEKRISFKLNKSTFQLCQQLKSDSGFGTHDDFALHLLTIYWYVFLSFFLKYAFSLPFLNNLSFWNIFVCIFQVVL